MITEDEVMRVLEDADPVRGRPPKPLPNSTQYLDTLLHRGVEMTLVDSALSEGRPTRNRWVIVAAAAILAIVVGAVAFAVRQDTGHDQVPLEPPETVPAEATTNAELVARQFVEALAAFDADGALTYLTDDVVAAEWGSEQDFRLWLAFMDAVGSTTFNVDCQPSSTAIRCAVDNHMFRSNEMGLGPYSGYWEIEVRDRSIISASFESDVSGPEDPFTYQLWNPFRSWVSREYPDDIAVMYDEDGGWRITEETIPVWEQRIREYASSGAAYVARGFIGLPAPGSTPSSPETGELVDEFFILRAGYHFSGAARLYADGRFIWRMYFPVNGWGSSTGWMEQRLTPEGVELLLNRVEVGHGPGGEVREIPGFGVSEWLPPSAWDDQWFAGYVPSAYGVCLTVFDTTSTRAPESTVDELLAMLPGPAAALLAGREPVAYPDPPGTHHCLRVSIDEARQLDAALSDAGVSQDVQTNAYMLQYYVDVPEQPALRLEIAFEPVFPDGTTSCSACG